MPNFLTKRQRQIVTLLVEGHSIVSAAASLGITEQVAKNHLRFARLRLGTNTYGLVGKVAVEMYRTRLLRKSMG